MKLLPSFFIAAFMLVGCDSEQSDPKRWGADYRPTIEKPIPFRLPAGSSTIQITQKPGDAPIIFEQSAYTHPNQWVIYMATAPWVKEGSRSFVHRANMDTQTSIELFKFLDKNGLRDRVKIVWLQYDNLPLSKAEGWGGLTVGTKIAGNLGMVSTHGSFDAYVISPASRWPEGGTLLYSEWLRPFIVYTGPQPEIRKHSDIENGINDNNSEFWDNWGRHFFIVDPEGMVQDAYLSIGNAGSTGWPLEAMRSIAHHLGVDQKTGYFPDHNPQAKYNATYSSTLEGEYHKSINLIDQGVRGE